MNLKSSFLNKVRSKALKKAGALGFLACFSAAAEKQPNVVLIYADDLGYGDLGCYPGEGRIPTPNCDRLAAEGLRFTQAYTAASVCTPARYSLLTGRYPWRTWLKKGVVGNTPALIDPDTFTMADLFRSAGYQTACIGKWHIGFGDRGQKDLDWNAEIPKGPRELGFDYFFGMPVSHFYPPYVYIENRHVHNLDPADPLWLEWPDGGGMPIQHGGEAATYKQEEAGREVAERACRWIGENKDEPFFLFYAAIEPHTPFTPHPDYHGTSGAGLYGDFVVQFDAGVGRILQTLEQQGIAENTIVIVTSDNGGIATNNGHFKNNNIEYNPNVPLYGDKGDFLEGGLRIPFIIRWPGTVAPGGVSDEIICQTDLLAAFAGLLNLQLPFGAAEDSRDILAALKGGAAPVTPVVLQSRAGFHALRQGEWIYLDGSHAGDWDNTPIVDTPGQLYRLSTDLHQDNNLYAAQPERVGLLLGALDAIRDPSPPLPRNRVRLATFGFSSSPTPSKVDADFAAAGIEVSNLAEHGDPDGGGTSPELTNFTGNSLNIKRNSVDADPDNFSDYIAFSISTAQTNHVLQLHDLELQFNQFADHFSLTVHVDAGDGFQQAATLGGGDNDALAGTRQRLVLDSVAAATSVAVRIEFAHAHPGGAANTTLQLSEIGVNGWLIDPGRPTRKLLSYEFRDAPTPSRTDPDFLEAGIAASDLTEYGDPDEGGTSPELTNFSGSTLNIKRNAVDELLDDGTDYATFTIASQNGQSLIEADDIELGFDQFADDFSLGFYANVGGGFCRLATLGGTNNAGLAFSSQRLDLRALPASTAVVFRIEFAHAQPGGANWTLQLSRLDLNGIVKTAAGFVDDVGLSVLEGAAQGVLRWNSRIGASYRVESTACLVSDPWTQEGAIRCGDGGTMSVPAGLAGTRGFFRVGLLE